MPTYEYRCLDGHIFEKFQKMAEKPRAKCPVCGKPAMRMISGGGGLVFKGTGFYITDYGKDGKGPRKAESEGAADTKPASDTSRERHRSKAASETGRSSPPSLPPATAKGRPPPSE